MIPAIRHPLRLARIAFVLSRHDALFPLEAVGLAPYLTFPLRLIRRRSTLRPGQRLAQALESLGPTFVKLGQALSVRSDLMGEEVSNDLGQLQDRLPPFPAKEARAILERELGPIATLFSSFDDEPTAAGSIAQVHRAIDSDGKAVAVKIIRPGIDAAFAQDLSLLFWLAGRIERTQPGMRRLKPREVIATLADTVRAELDLRFEAAAAEEFSRPSRSPLEGEREANEQLAAPAVDWNRTSTRILTLSWVNGIPLNQLNAIDAAKIDREKLLRHIAEGFFRQVFEHGYFHADLHPGNLFAHADGTATMVDFGITGRMSHRDRITMAEVLRGFLDRDYEAVARAHIHGGWVPIDTSAEKFASAMRAVGEPILGKPLSEISIGRLLGQLFSITETFRMETQTQLLLLQKSLVLVEGLGRTLCPHVNMWELVRPVIEEWAKKHLSPQARIKAQVKELLALAPLLPAYLRKLESVIPGHRASDTPQTQETQAAITTTAHPVLWLLLGAALGLCATLCLTAV